MDVIALKEYLKDQPDKIEQLLHSVDFCNIKRNSSRREIRCSRDYDRNPTSVVIKYDLDNIPFTCFSTGLSGDIISLLQNKLDISFRSVLKYMYSALRLSDDALAPIERYLPFGAYYKKIQSKNSIKDIDLQTYPDEIMNDFKMSPNMLFLRDGISIDTQMKYNVGYDSTTMRVSVPWYNHNEEIVGVMGRINTQFPDADISKWLPIIPFAKSKAIYGYSLNYSDIQNKKVCMIGESEKLPQQLDSMGYKTGTSVGGSNISSYHQRYLKSLNAEKYILMFDEGLTEDKIRSEAEKLQAQNVFQQYQVGYVFDKYNEILKSGSKMAPTDLGKLAFKELYNNHIVWL